MRRRSHATLAYSTMLIWATRVGHRVTDSLVSYEWTSHHLTGHAYMFTCVGWSLVFRRLAGWADRLRLTAEVDRKGNWISMEWSSSIVLAIWTGWRTEEKHIHERLHAYLLLTCLHARMLACVPSDRHSLTPHWQSFDTHLIAIWHPVAWHDCHRQPFTYPNAKTPDI